MDAFSYLSVLLSIIVGLAITQILQGYRALLLSRSRVRLYGPPLIWSVVMLVMATQVWWSSFGLSHHRDWTFGAFGMVMVQTVLLYVMAGLVLPDMPPGEPVDLREHYRRETTPLYSVLLATLAVSVLKERLLEGRLPLSENMAFHAAFALLAAAALVFRRPRFHEILTLGMAATGALYIALLFRKL